MNLRQTHYTLGTDDINYNSVAKDAFTKPENI